MDGAEQDAEEDWQFAYCLLVVCLQDINTSATLTFTSFWSPPQGTGLALDDVYHRASRHMRLFFAPPEAITAYTTWWGHDCEQRGCPYTSWRKHDTGDDPHDFYLFCCKLCSECEFEDRLGFWRDENGEHYECHRFRGQMMAPFDRQRVSRFGGDRCTKYKAEDITGNDHEYCSPQCKKWNSSPCENFGCDWPCFYNETAVDQDYPLYCSPECTRTTCAWRGGHELAGRWRVCSLLRAARVPAAPELRGVWLYRLQDQVE